jgi:cytoskeletal protein RodZ
MQQTQLSTTEFSETGSSSGQTMVMERPATVVVAGKPGFLPPLRGKFSARLVAIISVAVLVVTGLLLWGAGVFSATTPRVSLAVVGPASLSKQVAATLDANKTAPLQAAVSHSEKAATRQVRNDSASAILVVDPPGTTDTLQVPSNASKAQATQLEDLVRAAEASLHRTVTVTTVATTATH